MKACGLIVEYNPFHNGHLYHLQQSRMTTDADCIIAVMSGSFLQRGEPAIIDKFHRTRAALHAGVDIMLELPYPYAVQSSDFFAKGAVLTLNEIGADSICFGSESGNIEYFKTAYHQFEGKKHLFQEVLKSELQKGTAFPEASRIAYGQIGLTTDEMDLSKPNNILGFSYVKTILDRRLSMDAYTIKRTNNNYHDQSVTSSIASATSIRKAIFDTGGITEKLKKTMPYETQLQMQNYKTASGVWHTWETYFPFLHYRVMTMSLEELANIHDVEEGLEYRIKKSAKMVTSFQSWMNGLKTKRYTRTRLQRIFVHILTNTTKEEMELLKKDTTVPYIRLLGMTKKGQSYLNRFKKEFDVPLVTNITKNADPMLLMEERASNAYYSVLPPGKKFKLRRQEFQPPVIQPT
ncbi:nucleotidyltransferase [Virgibacillus kimchii]